MIIRKLKYTICPVRDNMLVENVLSHHLLRPVWDGMWNKTDQSHSIPTGRDCRDAINRVSTGSTNILSLRDKDTITCYLFHVTKHQTLTLNAKLLIFNF
jgi:hypothetical protein